jgi:plastocyanin
VDGAASDDVWVAGSPVRRFDGASFATPPQPPSIGTLDTFWPAVASPARGDAWVAGMSEDAVDVDNPDPSRTAVAHFSGGAWTVTPTPSLGRGSNLLNDIDFGTPRDGWTVGTAESARALLIERWAGGHWELFGGETPAATSAGGKRSELTAVDELADGTAFTVGYTERDRGQVTLAERICPIKVGLGGFQPAAAQVNSRQPVAWIARGSGHTVTDATGLGLFDSGTLADGAGFTFRPPAAAGYRTRDRATGHTGTLAVPLNVTRLSGGAYRVSWAGTLPSGLVVDVQLQEPGDSGFESFRTATRAGGADFTPRRGPGSYRFRSRLRRPGGPATDWSPVKTVVVR